jgi:tetratricopeptide (TPR) repeat protein
MSQVSAPGWRRSPAHIFLLANFLEPGSVEELTTRLDWEQALGDAPGRVIEQFQAVGLLQYVDQDLSLEDRLARFTVKELQAMLRAQGLPVSGRKGELIARLIEADPGGMEETTRAESPLHCTEEGQEAVAAYLAAVPAPEAEEPSEAEPFAAEASRSSEIVALTAEDHVSRGLALGREGDLAGALAEFGLAVERDPQYARAYYWRGVILEQQGDYALALTAFHRAIALDARHADFYVGRGDAYRKLGDFRMAILEYDAALDRNPRLAMAYHNRGVAHECLGDYERALGDYGKAAELCPECPEPCFGLGVIYEHAGDYERAAEQFQRAIQLAADAQFVAQARERLGRVQMRL